MAWTFFIQVSLSSLCFIPSDFWHKAHTNQGEKQRKVNTIKYPGAVRVDLTKLTWRRTQKNLHKVFYWQMFTSWACIHASWRTLKCPWHFAEQYDLVFAPTPYGTSQLWEASQHVQVAPPPSQRSNCFSLEPTSASTNLSSSFMELFCTLSELGPEDLILNVAQPFNQIPLMCWTRSLPSSRNTEALNKEHFQQSRPRLKA